jgi:hypothetical protein
MNKKIYLILLGIIGLIDIAAFSISGYFFVMLKLFNKEVALLTKIFSTSIVLLIPITYLVYKIHKNK